MTLYIWRAKFIINTLETTTFLSNSTLTSRLKIPSFDWFVLTGGYGNYLLAMSERIAKQSTDTLDIKKLSLGWMIGYLFVVSFLRLFSVVPLRKVYRIFVHFRKIQVALMGNKRKEKKRITLEISSSNTRKLCRSCNLQWFDLWLCQIMIIDFKLTYPSGTATAHLINSFHTPQGAKLAK